MKAAPIVAIAFALAISGAMLSGAGWTANAGGSAGNGDIVKEVSDTANNTPVEITGDTGSQDDGDIVGFIINGADVVGDIVFLGLTIGSALADNGFPQWFTNPLGWVIQLTLTVGFAQFVIGRVFR